MQVQLQECATELVVVPGTQALAQLVVVLRVLDQVAPVLLELARILPVRARHAIEEREDRLRVASRQRIRPVPRVEDRITASDQLTTSHCMTGTRATGSVRDPWSHCDLTIWTPILNTTPKVKSSLHLDTFVEMQRRLRKHAGQL